MDEEIVDSLAIQINKKLVLPPTSTKPITYRVPENQRTAAERKTYEPCMLAIGPYYRGKKALQPMEQQKRWYLNLHLQRRGETDVTRYLQAIREMEKEARTFYAEDVLKKFTSSDAFVEMMLLDGFFVVELLCSYGGIDLWINIGSSNSFNSLGWDNNLLARDLLLVENQIPFKVIQKLFEMTYGKEDELAGRNTLVLLIFYFFTSVLHQKCPSFEVPTGEIKHLLGLIHSFWFSSSKSLMGNMKFDLKKWKNRDWKYISCATELREDGIKFKLAEAKALSEVKFDNGTLCIPQITITAQSESIFKNLIVYERFFLEDDNNLTVSNYMKFMDCLINSSKDVKLLCKRKILHNRLGDHEVVASLFNKLGDFFTPSVPNSYYCDVFKRVDDHCNSRCNKWIAVLKQRYLDSPWAAISIFAAVILLLLTLGQTVFAVLAYYYK